MILLSQIDLGIRARTTLSGIPALAEDISTKGLISPILLTKKTPELTTEYEAFYKISLDPNRPVLLTCGGRRLAALTSSGTTILYPNTSCDVSRPGYILRDSTSLLDLLLIEGRENRNRQDLDWRDDMKLIVSAYRLAKQQANEEGEYLVMKDFASLLGVSHTHLGVAERIYDDYLSDPRAFEGVTSIYGALSLSLKRVGDVATKILLHRQLNEKPIIREVKPEGGDISVPVNHGPQPDLGPAAVQPSAGPVTIPLSQAFFQTDAIDFMANQPSGFCDHIVTELTTWPLPQDFLHLCHKSLSPKGYLAFWLPTKWLEEWRVKLLDFGFLPQLHPLIWNKIDYRHPTRNSDKNFFFQSYETCLLACKPDSQLSQLQNASVYTSSHKKHEHTFGPNHIPPELFSWVIRAISVPGQIIYDPFAQSGASAIGTISVKCRPLGTESNPIKYQKLIENLKAYYTKQLPSVQFT